ncbi:MAG: potassium channel family protein [Methanomicrobiales archaeon]|nr:potassium channel family protein [Methanomicrobiales archaeon]MDD1660683.1 potassium channel family protein [Methanomicrobiales archaeon]
MVSPFSRIRVYLLILGLVIAGGTAGIMLLEGLGPAEALYFVIVTIATVGYGDITPLTTAGKLFTVALILAGVGFFVGVFANVIETMLERAERRERVRKIHMLIGVFFSEAGTDLLGRIARLDPLAPEIRKDLVVSTAWTPEDFKRLRKRLTTHRFRVDGDRVDLDSWRTYLRERRALFITLLENPVLFEHETFTDLLQAFFHLTDELLHRGDLSLIPAADRAHLVSDLERGYALLVQEWVAYMAWLKEHYPYLFSLAMRTNPFDEAASVIVKG